VFSSESVTTLGAYFVFKGEEKKFKCESFWRVQRELLDGGWCRYWSKVDIPLWEQREIRGRPVI
jgi:hypothetical protein